jgi:hypothetical protein
MSRRLENIQTGFVDYGGAAASLNQAFVQGTKIRIEEEDRQRRIQQEEDARMAGGAQLYAGWMDEVDKMENGLDPEARAKFVERFNGVKEGYRGLQEAISKGVKVGTPQYYELYNQVNIKKKSLLEQIGLIKQLNESKNELAKVYASGSISKQDTVNALNTQREALLNGTYKPSNGLVTPEQVIMNSYSPASKTIKAISTAIPFTTSIDADYQNGEDGRKVVKTTRYIPSFSGSIATIDNFLTNSSPRETIDITDKLNTWKSGEKVADSTNYKYYLAYMNTEAVKADPQYATYGGIKKPEQFTETDYALMESLPAKFKPNVKETESFATSTQTKNIESEIFTDKYMKEIYSGDMDRVSKALFELRGSLKTRGWKIDRTGNTVNIVKSKDEWSDAVNESFDLSDPAQKTTALDLLNRMYGSIGKSGAAYLRKN